MGITGNLETMMLAELLQWLAQSQKTGTLVVDDGQVEKRIFFRGGTIISSASTEPREYLGHFLVGHGLITEEQLADAMKRQEAEKKLLGKILTDMGAIAPDALEQMLSTKAEEAIYDLFLWPSGDFRFLDNELPEYQMVPIALDVTGLVFEATRRIDHWNRMRETISSLDMVVVSVVDDLTAGVELDDSERLVLQAVNDDRTIEEIAFEARASDYLVCEALYAALQRRHIKLVRCRSAAPAPPAAAGATPSAARPAAVELSASSLIKKASSYLANQEYGMALRYLRAARSLEPDNREIRRQVEVTEATVRKTLEEAGIVPSAVPELAVRLEQLTTLAVSSRAGFLLSRINGSYDVGSIVKISPMQPLEAQIELWKLVAAGHVRIKEP